MNIELQIIPVSNWTKVSREPSIAMSLPINTDTTYTVISTASVGKGKGFPYS